MIMAILVTLGIIWAVWLLWHDEMAAHKEGISDI